MGSAKVQGELWSLAAQDWANLQEPLTKPLWVAMIDATKVGNGTRFFDAGCGGGGASIIAAERGAIISGLDASDALIAIARKRLPEGDCFYFRAILCRSSGSASGIAACLRPEWICCRQHLGRTREMRPASCFQGCS